MINQSIEQIQSAIDTCIYICISKMGMGKNRNINAIASESHDGYINIVLMYDIGRIGSINFSINPNLIIDDTELIRDRIEFTINKAECSLDSIINRCWHVMEDIGLLSDMKEVSICN